MYMFDVLLQRFAEYEFTVDVNEGELPFQAGQDNVSGSLEYGGCVAESEWHTFKAIGL